MNFWPYAGMHFCSSVNCTSANTESVPAYSVRYPDKRLPTLHESGCLVHIVPKNIKKGETRSKRAIYLGHTTHAGEIGL